MRQSKIFEFNLIEFSVKILYFEAETNFSSNEGI
jgi:hypothetical protein